MFVERGMPLARNLELELELRGPELLRTVVVGAAAWGPYPSEARAIEESFMVVLRNRPAWSRAAQIIALAIGFAESRFGVTPDWQFPSGTPSWNWGAMVMKGTAGTLKHPDHEADGKPAAWDFAAWNSADEGFGAWARMMERPGLAPAQSALQAGNALGVAEGMYADCLFSGTCPPSCSDAERIAAYGKLIAGASAKMASSLGIANPVSLGHTVGVPMGKCSWHDAKGGGGGGGGGGVVPISPAGGSSDSTAIVAGLVLLGGLFLFR